MSHRPDKKRILIVEDDEILRRMYVLVFERHGYEVDEAVTGPESLAKARATMPDAIVLDIMIPDINGLEVLGQLKDDPQTKDIPVVMLSNLTSQEYQADAKSKDAALYIIKTDHEPRQICDMVAEILAK